MHVLHNSTWCKGYIASLASDALQLEQVIMRGPGRLDVARDLFLSPAFNPNAFNLTFLMSHAVAFLCQH
jgi:hypothetical protein